MIHGFSGDCDPGSSISSMSTFSFGIFPILPKASGKGTKKGAVVVRVSGSTSNREAVVAKAREIVDQLDRGEYRGPKHVRVK